jgi:hypothetical protein
MKLQKKKTPAKKPKPQANDMSDNDMTVDITGYGAAQPTYNIGGGLGLDTITLDSTSWQTGSITAPSTLTWTQPYDNYTVTGGLWNNHDPSVNIGTNGVEIKGNGDLKIGDRSMKDFMDRVEDQLAILRPAPELEEKWDKLKELRRQYEECKQDILEKEKIMKILKET